jgi:serine acetyltransferase
MARYTNAGGWHRNFGFWVTLVYRFGSWACRIRPSIVGLPFRALHGILAIPIRIFFHVYLPSKTIIGPGLSLPHPHLILIPPESEIGPSCTIYHNVTLGHGTIPGVPKLANNVVAFTGAKILGGIHIGEHAHIGVNAVTMRNVEPGVMVSMPLCRAIPMFKARVTDCASNK